MKKDCRILGTVKWENVYNEMSTYRISLFERRLSSESLVFSERLVLNERRVKRGYYDQKRLKKECQMSARAQKFSN